MKIAKETLFFILEVCRSSFPREFAAMLQAEGDVITEVVMVPGTYSSDENAVMQLFMLPNIYTVGTVHSHPSGNLRPSRTDMELFERKGKYHIIVGTPYSISSWKCYDKNGKPITLEVIDYKFEGEDEVW